MVISLLNSVGYKMAYGLGDLPLVILIGVTILKNSKLSATQKAILVWIIMAIL